MKTKVDVMLFLARDLAADTLEPLVDCLLANGITQAQVMDAVTASVRRSLKVSLSDANSKLSVAEFDVEAGSVAKKLFARLTVKDAGRVPPVNARRGLPAAMAARRAA